MLTAGEVAHSLHRPVSWIAAVHRQLAVPRPPHDVGYSTPYRIFLRTISYLQALGVSEDRIIRLWEHERRLLDVLCAEASGSPTWFIDQCGQRSARSRRLLLTNYDVGVELAARGLQLGLDLGPGGRELFSAQAMGVDALQALDQYLAAHQAMRDDVARAVPRVRAAAAWAVRLP